MRVLDDPRLSSEQPNTMSASISSLAAASRVMADCSDSTRTLGDIRRAWLALIFTLGIPTLSGKEPYTRVTLLAVSLSGSNRLMCRTPRRTSCSTTAEPGTATPDNCNLQIAQGRSGFLHQMRECCGQSRLAMGPRRLSQLRMSANRRPLTQIRSSSARPSVDSMWPVKLSFPLGRPRITAPYRWLPARSRKRSASSLSTILSRSLGQGVESIRGCVCSQIGTELSLSAAASAGTYPWEAIVIEVVSRTRYASSGTQCIARASKRTFPRGVSIYRASSTPALSLSCAVASESS